MPGVGSDKQLSASETALSIPYTAPTSYTVPTAGAVVKPTIVTPSASSVKATVGFLEKEDTVVKKQTPPVSPLPSKKPGDAGGLKLKVSVANSPRSSPKTVQQQTNVKKAEGAVGGMDVRDGDNAGREMAGSNLRSAVEMMGLEGDEGTIQSSVNSMKPVATPKSKLVTPFFFQIKLQFSLFFPSENEVF